jgi:hypothetical protein
VGRLSQRLVAKKVKRLQQLHQRALSHFLRGGVRAELPLEESTNAVPEGWGLDIRI